MKKLFEIAIGSFSDLIKPRILILSFAPLLLCFGLWFFVLYYTWPQLDSYLTVSNWKLFIIGLLCLVALFPAMGITALSLISLLAMPVIVPYVRTRYFPNLEAKKGFSFFSSFKNSMFYLLIYFILFLITLPTWLIPFVGAVVSVGVNTFINKKILYFDCLANMASPEEFKKLKSKYRKEIWMMAFVLALFMLIPGYFLIAPIHAGLTYTKFSFEKLSEFRSSQ